MLKSPVLVGKDLIYPRCIMEWSSSLSLWNFSRSYILSDTLRSVMKMQCKQWLILCTVASGHLGSGGFMQCWRPEGRGSNMHDTPLRWLNNSRSTVQIDWYVSHLLNLETSLRGQDSKLWKPHILWVLQNNFRTIKHTVLDIYCSFVVFIINLNKIYFRELWNHMCQKVSLFAPGFDCVTEYWAWISFQRTRTSKIIHLYLKIKIKIKTFTALHL